MKPLLQIDGTGGARLPIKPTISQPCNGCGWCCASEPCGIAREFIGADGEGPCPALEWDGARFGCGMIVRPLVYLGQAMGLEGAISLPRGAKALATPEGFGRGSGASIVSEADAELGRWIAEALGAGRGCDADDP